MLLRPFYQRSFAGSNALRSWVAGSTRYSSSSSSSTPDDSHPRSSPSSQNTDAPQTSSPANKRDSDLLLANVAQDDSVVPVAPPPASFFDAKKNYLSSIPRVPNTANIDRNDLYLDMLFSGYRPLFKPIRENHTRSPLSVSSTKKLESSSSEPIPGRSPSVYSPFTSIQKKPIVVTSISQPRTVSENRLNHSSSILDDLKEYKRIKKANKVKNYNPYFSNVRKFTPVYTVFTNSVLNTEQHDLELFNLPLRVVENLRPFQVSNQPGQELFRDDMIYTRRLEVEERILKQRKENKVRYRDDLEKAKRGEKRLKIDDAEEFFGFK
ncbi:DEKNAAC105224 [Brettanomyces naardenensis]|uniref:DEKNAAC105224 n=1 Tax=Brettanomyces naardenensis TaxID=13370 RepID=A0A448YT62_BRENA|nr:DEKNAAC105224 [Brettanomyces naardenensis]